MSTKYKSPGKILTLTADQAISADEVVSIGAIVGMAITSADSGASVEVAVEGVYEFPAKSADVIAAGDLLYWDDGNTHLTKTAATGSYLVGYAVGASGSGTTTVDVKLTGQASVVEA